MPIHFGKLLTPTPAYTDPKDCLSAVALGGVRVKSKAPQIFGEEPARYPIQCDLFGAKGNSEFSAEMPNAYKSLGYTEQKDTWVEIRRRPDGTATLTLSAEGVPESFGRLDFEDASAGDFSTVPEKIKALGPDIQEQVRDALELEGKMLRHFDMQA